MLEENNATLHSSPFLQGKKPLILIVKKDVYTLNCVLPLWCNTLSN